MDLPAPVFQWIDAGIAGLLPPLARIIFWGLLSGLVSMGLYSMISPQGRIAQGKRDTAEARRALDAFEGELSEAAPLIRRLLRLSLRQVRLTALPAILASLPVLTVLAWMSTAYGSTFPAPGAAAAVEVRPPQLHAQWMEPASAGRPPHVLITDAGGTRIADLPLPVPVHTLHPWQWWNALLGNPAGYLPRDGAVRQVRLELPRRHFISAGPDWARGWELPFFTALVLASLILKITARIQ